MSDEVRRFPRLLRDWRVRTLVPIVVIHLVAFGAIYALIFRFAEKNVVMSHKFGAAMLLDELELNFQDMMVDHTGPMIWMRLTRQARVHKLVSVNVYNPTGKPVFGTRGMPSFGELSAANATLGMTGRPNVWMTDPQSRLVLIGSRSLLNSTACRGCHDGGTISLGVIQMGVDLTGPMAEAKSRARRHLSYIVGAWLVLFALMTWIRRIVIGRPLKQIEESIDDGSHVRSADLESLATRLNGKLWKMIDSQREREETMTRQMVRAEQLASLGEMAAGLTHEIKNPIAGVIAALELLRSEEAIAKESEEVCDQMLGELHRVTGTLDSLLRLAKPQPPRRAPVDLQHMVRELVSLFSARCRRQGVTLQLEAGDSIPTLSLDAGLMAQLLINLLTNSLQASQRGGTIKVLLGPFPRRDGVLLIVEDTGKGIAPEQLERVFDPFFTTKEEGTGLGLAICRQIVAQHGGTIDVESESGKGTKVVVLLPDLQAAEREENYGAVAAG
ncbi:MAG: hypothetical protein JJE51_11180 [Thermoanaerobaculia bacterium]|nr:hypothetical protein [Thermoanaerobaculia bacterium]